MRKNNKFRKILNTLFCRLYSMVAASMLCLISFVCCRCHSDCSKCDLTLNFFSLIKFYPLNIFWKHWRKVERLLILKTKLRNINKNWEKIKNFLEMCPLISRDTYPNTIAIKKKQIPFSCLSGIVMDHWFRNVNVNKNANYYIYLIIINSYFYCAFVNTHDVNIQNTIHIFRSGNIIIKDKKERYTSNKNIFGT